MILRAHGMLCAASRGLQLFKASLLSHWPKNKHGVAWHFQVCTKGFAGSGATCGWCRLCFPGFSEGTRNEAPHLHGCDGALLRQQRDAGMLTLDLSKAQANSEPSHTDGRIQVSSYAFQTRFGGLFHSSVSGCTGRTVRQPTSFAEHLDGQLSASDALFSQDHFSCRLQGLAEAGTTRAPPSLCPVSVHAGEDEAIPASDITDAPSLSDASPQTAPTLQLPSIAVC